MIDILCIGTAVIDISASPIPADKANWMEKQRIGSIRLSLGGDGANQSVRLADLGLRTALSAAIGNDSNGNVLKNILQERGVSVDHLVVKDSSATGTALVLVDENGNRNTFSVQGAHSTLCKQDLPDLHICHPKLITIASLFSLPLLESDGLLEYLQHAKSLGILIAADLGSDKKHQGLDGIKAFLPYLDFFWPSDYDAMQMTGTTSVEEAARIYLSYGCKNVVIKCGPKGCFYANASTQGYIPALPVTPVDTTGAGDCMAALMTHHILQGKGIEEICSFACTGASLSTLYAGASDHRLTEEEIRSYR